MTSGMRTFSCTDVRSTTDVMATKWQATAATTMTCHTSWYPNTRGNGSGQWVKRNTAPTVNSTPPTAMSTSSAIDMCCPHLRDGGDGRPAERDVERAAHDAAGLAAGEREHEAHRRARPRDGEHRPARPSRRGPSGTPACSCRRSSGRSSRGRASASTGGGRRTSRSGGTSRSPRTGRRAPRRTPARPPAHEATGPAPPP